MTKHIIGTIFLSALLAACQNAPAEDGLSSEELESDDRNVLADKQVDDFNGKGTDTVTSRDTMEDITMEPRTRYATYFLDDYAEQGKCADPSQLLTLADGRAEFGDVNCNIASVEGVDDIVTLQLHQCMMGATKTDDRRYKMNLVGMNTLKLSDGAKAYTLKRC